jgi:hypothetical protein
MRRLAAIFALALAAGCGGAGPLRSCDRHDIDGKHRCFDFVGSEHSDEGVSAFCAGHGTVVSECPTQDEIGYCLQRPWTNSDVHILFYSDMPIEKAQEECASNHGTFMPVAAR